MLHLRSAAPTRVRLSTRAQKPPRDHRAKSHLPFCPQILTPSQLILRPLRRTPPSRPTRGLGRRGPSPKRWKRVVTGQLHIQRLFLCWTLRRHYSDRLFHLWRLCSILESLQRILHSLFSLPEGITTPLDGHLIVPCADESTSGRNHVLDDTVDVLLRVGAWQIDHLRRPVVEAQLRQLCLQRRLGLLCRFLYPDDLGNPDSVSLVTDNVDRDIVVLLNAVQHTYPRIPTALKWADGGIGNVTELRDFAIGFNVCCHLLHGCLSVTSGDLDVRVACVSTTKVLLCDDGSGRSFDVPNGPVVELSRLLGLKLEVARDSTSRSNQTLALVHQIRRSHNDQARIGRVAENVVVLPKVEEATDDTRSHGTASLTLALTLWHHFTSFVFCQLYVGDDTLPSPLFDLLLGLLSLAPSNTNLAIFLTHREAELEFAVHRLLHLAGHLAFASSLQRPPLMNGDLDEVRRRAARIALTTLGSSLSSLLGCSFLGFFANLGQAI
mmetsp:Transcript_18231/g.40284  ORF Transcript_18231/g.40284 Transcript_18231/m.40284 type:complete len:494 (+) Transcript_18231:333-1814(+)